MHDPAPPHERAGREDEDRRLPHQPHALTSQRGDEINGDDGKTEQRRSPGLSHQRLLRASSRRRSLRPARYAPGWRAVDDTTYSDACSGPPRSRSISGPSIDFTLTGGDAGRAYGERWHGVEDFADWMRESPALAVEARVMRHGTGATRSDTGWGDGESMPDRRAPAVRILARGVGVGAVVGAVLGAAFMIVLAATAVIGVPGRDHARPETELIILAVGVAAAVGIVVGAFVGAMTALAVLAHSTGHLTTSMRATATLTCGVASGAAVSVVIGIVQPEPVAVPLISGGILGVLSASIGWMITPTLARP